LFWICILKCGCKKKKNKEKKIKMEKEKEYSQVYVCVWMFLCMLFYDKVAKNEKEFNILICIRLKIMNLHISCISNNRWNNKIFKTSLTHQSHEAAYLR
jgi:hypothetical protein